MISKFLIGKIVFKKYKIIKFLEKGTFGTIFVVNLLNTKKNYAAKVEYIYSNVLLLKCEAYNLMNLKGVGIPEILSFGRYYNYDILIETLLGKSLASIFNEKNRKFCLKDICMIGIQMLDRLEFIHSKEFIHRDIKPSNFLVGDPDTSLIYIIDFGTAKKYRSSRTGRHIKQLKINRLSGTISFLSLNSLKGFEQSRRDDLVSFGYMMIYFAKGGLPWSPLKKGNMRDILIEVKNMKEKLSNVDLCRNLPNQFLAIMDYVQNLKFEEKPDYKYLQNLLFNLLANINEEYDGVFSWVEHSKISQIKPENSKRDLSKIKNESLHSRLFKKIIESFKRSKTLEANSHKLKENDKKKEECLKTGPNLINKQRGSVNKKEDLNLKLIKPDEIIYKKLFRSNITPVAGGKYCSIYKKLRFIPDGMLKKLKTRPQVSPPTYIRKTPRLKELNSISTRHINIPKISTSRFIPQINVNLTEINQNIEKKETKKYIIINKNQYTSYKYKSPVYSNKNSMRVKSSYRENKKIKSIK